MSEKTMTIIEKLIAIQTELNVPKTQENKFGGYKYRSLEDITNAVKPLLAKYQVAFVQSDRVECRGVPQICKDVIDMGHDEGKNWIPDIREIESVRGIRYFTVATATLMDASGAKIETTAEAEHPDNKKGMDPAQVSGSTSSYARKYAACALFAIDDNRDPDATNDHGRAGENENHRNGRFNGNHVQPRNEIAPATENGRHDAATAKKTTPAKTDDVQMTNPPAKEMTAAEKQLAFMARLGVKQSDIEDVLGKPFAEMTADDSAFLRGVVTLMTKQKMSFDDAVERQSIIDADKNGEQE